jgi:hypothetical protein
MITLLKLLSTLAVIVLLFSALPTSEGFSQPALESFEYIFDYAYSWNFLVPVDTLFQATLFTIFGQFLIFSAYIILLVLKIVRN